jgi:hypothetical protein
MNQSGPMWTGPGGFASHADLPQNGDKRTEVLFAGPDGFGICSTAFGFTIVAEDSQSVRRERGGRFWKKEGITAVHGRPCLLFSRLNKTYSSGWI